MEGLVESFNMLALKPGSPPASTNSWGGLWAGDLSDSGSLRGTEDGRVAYLAASSEGHGLVGRIHHEGTDALSLALEALSEAERQTLWAALPVLEALAESMQSR